MSYYYACPYCEQDRNIPNPSGDLNIVVDPQVGCSLGHKKGFFDKDKECRKEDFICKEVYQCKICEATFRGDEEFLKAQKRKDKDG